MGLTVTRNYTDGQALTKAMMDAQNDSIETFINTTKISTNEIQSGTIATTNIASAAITSSLIASSAVGTSAIADSAVTTVKIADANVTTAKILDANVTTAKIADSNVTSAKIASNINLPGSAAQENGKNLVVSNTNATNSLAIIRGTVASDGSLVTGEGFTSSKTSGGEYTITFSTAFADFPIIVVGSVIGGASVFSSITTSAIINTWIPTGTPTLADKGFSFFAIGQRA